MRLLCQFESIYYIACGEFLVAVDYNKSADTKYFNFSSGSGSQIVSVTLSANGEYVFGAFANKYICCWDTSTGAVLGSFLHSKRPTAFVCMESEMMNTAKKVMSLVISDKSGLIWGTDVPNFRKQVLLAGHTASVITDMTTDSSLIATADRDEKVRISNFPRMDTLQAFCMGHTNVVTSITFVKFESETLLVSCGWDHKLCLWNHKNGHNYDILQYDTSSSDHSRLIADSTSSVLAAAENVFEDAKLDILSSESSTVGDLKELAADEAEELAEKSYDEDIAGQYPVKVVATVSSSLVAVVFKNCPYVKIYSIVKGEKNGIPSFSFGEEVLVTLPAVPSDVCFSSDGDLLVLLPKPSYIQLFSVSLTTSQSGDCSASIQVNGYSDTHQIISAFQGLCIEKGVNFSQQLVSTVDGEDAEKGELH